MRLWGGAGALREKSAEATPSEQDRLIEELSSRLTAMRVEIDGMQRRLDILTYGVAAV